MMCRSTSLLSPWTVLQQPGWLSSRTVTVLLLGQPVPLAPRGIDPNLRGRTARMESANESGGHASSINAEIPLQLFSQQNTDLAHSVFSSKSEEKSRVLGATTVVTSAHPDHRRGALLAFN
ncbi:hypothetical protein KFK09_004957 [Dendrobium nobile]|uniref:Uncharacterized protein n=1 Tax=Dendrobium nobile TaxID=94219 RepID=A0A8T3BUH7_DENNO|nr:hypothetical protein KFK09_004957 [Dendrobium nobile]